MSKAILAAIITFVLGCLGVVIGLEFFGGYTELGLLVAVAVMGAFIIYFNEKKKYIANLYTYFMRE